MAKPANWIVTDKGLKWLAASEAEREQFFEEDRRIAQHNRAVERRKKKKQGALT